MSVKIRNIELNHGIMLAPMAGYTDRAMRRICRDYGCEYSVTEMVSAKAVVYDDKKTFSLAKILPDEGPVSIQIFGSEPEIMAEAADRLSHPEAGAPPVAIDVNMGCPVHKIFSNGEGSALMRSPTQIEKIVSAIKKRTTLPVTVKLRSGIDEKSINAIDCALAAEAGGADMICLHGRTRVQMYGGKSDRKIIKNVKNALHIPLFANGDITSADAAVSMFSETGADGIAIGRGAVGNPFLFEEIISKLTGKPQRNIEITERAEVALHQLRLAIEDKGERAAIPEARKQIALYLHGFRGAAQLRAKINLATTYQEVEIAVAEAVRENKANSEFGTR